MEMNDAGVKERKKERKKGDERSWG